MRILSEAQDLYDHVSVLLAEFKEFCVNYDIYYKDSKAFHFLKWAKELLKSILNENDDDTSFQLEFDQHDHNMIDMGKYINVKNILSD